MMALDFADLSLTWDRSNPRRFDAGHRDTLGDVDAGSHYYFVRVGRFTLALETVRHEPTP